MVHIFRSDDNENESESESESESKGELLLSRKLHAVKYARLISTGGIGQFSTIFDNFRCDRCEREPFREMVIWRFERVHSNNVHSLVLFLFERREPPGKGKNREPREPRERENGGLAPPWSGAPAVF
jgi:hypothetical protein